MPEVMGGTALFFELQRRFKEHDRRRREEAAYDPAQGPFLWRIKRQWLEVDVAPDTGTEHKIVSVYLDTGTLMSQWWATRYVENGTPDGIWSTPQWDRPETVAILTGFSSVRPQDVPEHIRRLPHPVDNPNPATRSVFSCSPVGEVFAMAPKPVEALVPAGLSALQRRNLIREIMAASPELVLDWLLGPAPLTVEGDPAP